MVTSDLGACEWFVWDLRRSGLIDRGQLDQIVSEFLKRNPRAEAPALAEYLVDQGTLTAFQAERILNGKTQGLVLGPYVLLDAIGQGSMGQVYKASSKNDNNLYAVKVLPRRSMWNVRLARRQVRSFGQFSHNAVVPFMDVGSAGGLHYLVWPLVEGSTLEAIVAQEGKLPPQQAALYAVQVAQGLNVACQNNLFHGLVKPSNVMIGSDNQARILDFGIGSLLVENEGESLVDTMSTANTLTSGLDCASPESIMEPTNRTPAGDQYSLGCVLYFCLTGRVPYPEGSAVEKMMAHQTKEPVPIQEFAPEVPDGLAEVVRRLMGRTPEERYTGCDEVVEALEPFLGDMSRSPGGGPAAAGAPAGRSSFGGVSARTPGYGSGGRMPGLPAKPSAPLPSLPTRSTTGGASPFGKAPSASDQPSFGGKSSAGGRPATPPPAGPGRSGLRVPGRDAFNLPPAEDYDTGVLSSAATPPPVAAEVPATVPSRAPAGWTDEEPPAARGGSGLGTLGLVAAAVLLMTAVYFGATMLMVGQ